MPSVFLAHAKTLEPATAKYTIRRVVCKSFAVPQYHLDVSREKLFSDQLPHTRRHPFGLVNNRAFNGHAPSNPFIFKHVNLSEIAHYLDGQQQHAITPIQPNDVHGLHIKAYDNLFAGTEKL